MLRCYGVLALALLAASLLPASTLAYPIKVEFTVLGDPTDPVNASLTGTGNFTFDSSVISLGLRPQAVRDISFSWDGRTWTEADAGLMSFSFGPDSSLIGWAVGGDANTVGNMSSTEQDFALGLSGPTLWFYYTTAGGPIYWGGTVVAWDLSTLPVIVATCYMPGTARTALDSAGRVFEYSDNACTPMGPVTVLGNMFGGPPPHPVVGMERGGGGSAIFVTLDNGDVWRMCYGAPGELIGNILYAPGIAAVEQDSPRAANSFALPRPNPFNPVTRIPYTMASPGRVRIEVFDVTGRLVRTVEDATRPAGLHVAQWDGRDDDDRDSASGTYFGRVTFPDGTTAERKMTILR